MLESKAKETDNKMEDSVVKEFLEMTLSFVGRFLDCERESVKKANRHLDREKPSVQQR